VDLKYERVAETSAICFIFIIYFLFQWERGI
jgi:hypothetical protein